MAGVRAVPSLLSTFFEPTGGVLPFLVGFPGRYEQGYASNVRSLSPLYDLISFTTP